MQQVIDELYNIAGGDAIVSTDVGQHQMWAAQFYKTNASWKWLILRRSRNYGLRIPRSHWRGTCMSG